MSGGGVENNWRLGGGMDILFYFIYLFFFIIYYHFKPISSLPLRPMNYLQLGFNQLTKTARDRWQITSNEEEKKRSNNN